MAVLSVAFVMGNSVPKYRSHLISRRKRQATALGLLLVVAWLSKIGQTAPAQVVHPLSAPGPIADTVRGLSEDSADEVVVPGDVDDILRLADQSLETLATQDVIVPAMDVTVSTVARQESTVGRSPAAVFVITGEMIRRSGARSIPEALRLAPGVNVARATSDRWAVSIRGFNGVYANKLLVQIDGRSVYSPVFSGVYWDQHQVLLEDVDRIEVIRGPGASVWGANAMNGVINIITKSAGRTQGVFVEGGVGTEERGFGAVRYGGSLGETLNYRLYGMAFERDGGFRIGNAANDDWRQARMGFRMDWEPCDCRALTVQGDYYDGTSGAAADTALPNPPYFGSDGRSADEEPSGYNILLRWSRKLSEDSDWAIQLYHDYVSRPTPDLGVSDAYSTLDLDFQHRFAPAINHSLIWGFGYRTTRNTDDGYFVMSFDPPVRSFGLISYFVQDEIAIRPDLLYLTLGSKFEHNDFSGFEYQPTARLLWLASQRSAVWASISRAVRTPSRIDQDVRIVSAPVAMSFAPPAVTFMRLDGSRAVESEQLLACEIGARAQPSDEFWWDLAVFYNRYDDLVTRESATPFPPPPANPPAFWPLVATNAMCGETYGFELAATLQLTPCWELQGGYSFLKMHLHAQPNAVASAENAEGESPRNQAYLQSSWDFGRSVELDLATRYVDSLPALGIPSYIMMDARLAWRPTEALEMAVVGRHFLDASHPEFAIRSYRTSEIQQEVYGIVTLRY